MCEENDFFQQFEWRPLLEVARSTSVVPKTSGVYCLKCNKPGKLSELEAIASYRKSPYVKALRDHERAKRDFLEGVGIPPREEDADSSYIVIVNRLDRLLKVDLASGKACPVLYLGETNNLSRRLDELLHGGHTANHPVWALLLAGWPIDYGWYGVKSFKQTESQVKRDFKDRHEGQLPPLVER
jgi:hypothetical protein